MRRGTFLAVAFLVFGGLGAPAASAQTDAVAVARALIDAENAHNVAAAVDLFAPGAVISLPTGALVTRTEIEQWQRDLAAGNFRAEITAPVALTSEIVTFTGTVAYDPFRRLGVSPLEATWHLAVQLGRVTIFDFDFTPSATARLQSALAGGAPTSTAATGGGGVGGSGAGSAGGSASASPVRAAPSRTLALTGGDLVLAGTAAGAIVAGVLVLLASGRRGRAPARRSGV